MGRQRRAKRTDLLMGRLATVLMTSLEVLVAAAHVGYPSEMIGEGHEWRHEIECVA